MSVTTAAAVIGAGTAIYGAVSASGAADDAAKAQEKANAEQLAWEKEQYAEWKETYGPLEDNLAEYYNNLTPTLRTMQGLQAFEKEKNVAMTSLRENLAQRGIATSGIAAQTETSVALESAAARAQIRADAPMEVAKEKASFLNIGLGNNPSNVSGVLADRSTEAGRVASATASAAGPALREAVTTTVDVAEQLYDVFNKKDGE